MSPRILLPAVLALLLALAPPSAGPAARRVAPAPPDTSFAGLVARLSEPGGYFDTDNLISNEASYLHVMGKLRELGLHGGAYIGVGPDQNFSYIAQIRPSVAIVIDIRRDNLLEHLLFKALFDLSRDRLEYLGALLGRPVPASRDAAEDVGDIVAYLDRTPMNPATFDSVETRVSQRLQAYGVPLTAADLATIRRFHEAFAKQGLDLRFESFGRGPAPYYPTFRQLILERDLTGRRASYLASDEAFQAVRSLEARGRVIPVVGDLAGDHAMPAIAEFLRERDVAVSAFYTSNVEFYLEREEKVAAFVANVRRLPRDGHGVIIRSVFRLGLPQSVPGYASTQLLQNMDTLLAAYDAGRVRGYFDLVTVGSMELR